MSATTDLINAVQAAVDRERLAAYLAAFARRTIRTARQSAAVAAAGGGTRRRTLSKADDEVLRGDTALYAAIAARIVTDPVLSYAFDVVARDFAGRIAEIAEETGDHFDFGPAERAAADFGAAAEQLERTRQQVAASGSAEQRAAMDAGLLRLSRILNPALYTMSGAYDQDPALQVPLLPGLSRAIALRTLDPASDGVRFRVTRLVRERNRIVDALHAATIEAERVGRECA